MAHQHIGLDGDVDDVPVVHDRLVDVARACIGIARRLHHDVDLRVDGNSGLSCDYDRPRVHRVVRLADLRGHRGVVGVAAGEAQDLQGALDVEVGHDRQLHAGRTQDLCGQPSTRIGRIR